MPDLLMTIEPGDAPGNPPQTPDKYHFDVIEDLELLLRSWEQAVEASAVPRSYRRIVRRTVKQMRKGSSQGTSVHHLIATVLAPAFLLPGELEVTGMTEATAIELGMDVEAAKKLPHIYPSLFDRMK